MSRAEPQVSDVFFSPWRLLAVRVACHLNACSLDDALMATCFTGSLQTNQIILS